VAGPFVAVDPFVAAGPFVEADLFVAANPFVAEFVPYIDPAEVWDSVLLAA